MLIRTCVNWPVATVLLAMLTSSICPADEITVGGVHYSDVYIRSTDSMYYVQTPEDGKVITALREAVVPDSVKITPDPEARAAILARWKSNNPRQVREARVREAMAEAASSEAQAATAPTTLRLQGNGDSADIRAMRSNGYVPYIKLKDVPLVSALDAILRPLGLDYRVYGDIVYVSSPALLNRESSGNMVTRHYNYYGNDTLHKIVLRNQFAVTGNAQTGGFGGAQGGGFGGGFGGQQGFGGGMAGQGGGFGNQGGFGGQQGFGGGQAGGAGGQGVGQGGTDVTATSNISDLFSTIDDRLVGEAPATIGVSYFHE